MGIYPIHDLELPVLEEVQAESRQSILSADVTPLKEREVQDFTLQCGG